MTAKFDLSNIWRNVKELDLQQIRDDAETDIRLAITSVDADKCEILANALRSDPRRPEAVTHTLLPLLSLEQAGTLADFDLVILISSIKEDSLTMQERLLSKWGESGQPGILVHDLDELQTIPADQALNNAVGIPVAYLNLTDWESVQVELTPLILRALPEKLLALGRKFPMLREMIAGQLINETSTANAAYAFSTGLAEIIPILDIPLNVADILILTKAQALLVYKLGLSMGLPVDWQYYITEFSGVIGSGFIWRQVARSLVGLIPAWGIIPKVAVAYSGTYAVGQAVLHWYLTGRHATKQMLKGFTREALARGKTIGKNLQARLPKSRPKQRLLLKDAEVADAPQNRICIQCSEINDPDSNFCKNCGEALNN